MNRWWLPLLLSCCSLAAGLGATEFKDLPDPTRPAPGFRAAAGARAGKGVVATSASAPDAALAVQPAKPMLTSIRMDLLGGKAFALIGDELVSVGDRVGAATVVDITRSEVTLRDEHGLHKMQMDEGVSKSPVGESAHREDARKPALKRSRQKETS
jgi:hypothetical protein